MLAPRRVLALLELLACGDHPSGFGDGDHRRDAVIVLEVQALGKVFPAVDLYMWHAAKFLDQADVIVAAVNHQHGRPVRDTDAREVDIVFQEDVVSRARRHAAVV
jgi:hypothetical protein